MSSFLALPNRISLRKPYLSRYLQGDHDVFRPEIAVNDQVFVQALDDEDKLRVEEDALGSVEDALVAHEGVQFHPLHVLQ